MAMTMTPHRFAQSRVMKSEKSYGAYILLFGMWNWNWGESHEACSSRVSNNTFDLIDHLQAS